MSDINEELLEALEDVIDYNIANKGTKSEFVICYTHGEDTPLCWYMAMKVAEKARAELEKEVRDDKRVQR